MSRRWGWGAWGLSATLSAGVAIYAFRYFLTLAPHPPPIVGNRYSAPFLYIHIIGAATALLIGPLNFVGAIRVRWPRAHRRIGQAYVCGCLIGGLGGLVAAFGSTAGPIVVVGFALLAACWILAGAQGWSAARAGRFAQHRAWMIRSFALTFAAVTLRLYMPLLPILHLPVLQGYEVISFLCWIPNLVLAELYLRRGSGGLAGAAQRVQA